MSNIKPLDKKNPNAVQTLCEFKTLAVAMAQQEPHAPWFATTWRRGSKFKNFWWKVTPRKKKKRVPWKSMVGRCYFLLKESPILGDMLVFRGVCFTFTRNLKSWTRIIYSHWIYLSFKVMVPRCVILWEKKNWWLEVDWKYTNFIHEPPTCQKTCGNAPSKNLIFLTAISQPKWSGSGCPRNRHWTINHPRKFNSS